MLNQEDNYNIEDSFCILIGGVLLFVICCLWLVAAILWPIFMSK